MLNLWPLTGEFVVHHGTYSGQYQLYHILWGTVKVGRCILSYKLALYVHYSTEVIIFVLRGEAPVLSPGLCNNIYLPNTWLNSLLHPLFPLVYLLFLSSHPTILCCQASRENLSSSLSGDVSEASLSSHQATLGAPVVPQPSGSPAAVAASGLATPSKVGH